MATSCGFESHRPHHWPPNRRPPEITSSPKPGFDGSRTRSGPGASPFNGISAVLWRKRHRGPKATTVIAGLSLAVSFFGVLHATHPDQLRAAAFLADIGNSFLAEGVSIDDAGHKINSLGVAANSVGLGTDEGIRCFRVDATNRGRGQTIFPAP